jgi:hypothetical protein
MLIQHFPVKDGGVGVHPRNQLLARQFNVTQDLLNVHILRIAQEDADICL